MQNTFATNDNDSGLGQRLRLEMKKRGISSVDLARRANVKTSFLYDVISGKSANPSLIKLARVAESLGISLTYLAGTSDSPNDGYPFALPSDVQDYVKVPHVVVEHQKLLVRENPQEPCQFHKEWIKKTIGIAPADARLFSVNGDNMAPTLLHGDTLLIDTTQKHPSPPGIFLLFDGMALVAKRLEMISPNDMRVICDNAHYSTYECRADAAVIVGRVVWFSRGI